MAISDQQRQQAEAVASDLQQQLYASPEAGAALWAIATRFNLTEDKDYNKFVEMVGDIILGFYMSSDLHVLIPAALPQLDGMTKIALEADIKMFLYPLSEESSATPSTPDTNLSSEIAETEKSIESLQGIRTMAADMHAVAPTAHTEHVYRSTQEEILTPKAAIGGQQRWDTEG